MGIGYTIAGVVGLLISAGAAQGADLAVHPAVAVTEEFTDNVFETTTGRVSDFITRAMPGIALTSSSSALEVDLNYFFDYRYYARRTHGTDSTHDLTARGRVKAVDNLLFLDVTDEYRRVSLDVTRDVTRESLFVNQEDRNVVTASPYFSLHPGQRTSLSTGYRFTDTRYFDSSSAIDKIEHSGFLEASYEFSPKWYATGGYTFTHEDNSIDDYDLHQPYAGFLYVYGGKLPAGEATTSTNASTTSTSSTVTGILRTTLSPSSLDLPVLDTDLSFFFSQVGYTWINYSSGNRLNNVYWNVGASHAFPAATVTVATGVRYDEDPLNSITQESFVIGGVTKRLKKGSLRLALYYVEFDQSTTDTVETRKYGGVARGSWDFSSRLNGNLGFTAEKYDQPPLNTYTRRFLVESGLGYSLGELCTVSLNYTYVDYFSPGIPADNKQVNRAILAVKKVF